MYPSPFEPVDEIAEEPGDLGVVDVPIGIRTQHFRDHIVGKHRALQKRVQNGVMQVLEVAVRPPWIVVGVVEAGLQKKVGELVEQLFHAHGIPVLSGKLLVGDQPHKRLQPGVQFHRFRVSMPLSAAGSCCLFSNAL